MIGHTKALVKVKEEQQQVLDFSVLICYAVPNLKKTIHGIEKDIPQYGLSKPYYYNENESIDRLKNISKDFQLNLSKYILLSNYSFFETYFVEVVNELIDFHGGKEQFINFGQRKIKSHLKNVNPTTKKHKSKLQEPLNKQNSDRYQNSIIELDKIPGYRSPSELFVTLGLKNFIETVNSNNFRSSMIPEMLEYAFNMDLAEKINKHSDLIDKNLKETFEAVRELRNRIAHGKCKRVSFDKVLDMVRFLRDLQVKIDKHLVNNFFVLERAR